MLTKEFAALLSQTLEGLRCFFRDDEYLYHAMPLATDAAISESVDKAVEDLLNDRKQNAERDLSMPVLKIF